MVLVAVHIITQRVPDLLHLTLPARIASLVLTRLPLLAEELIDLLLRWYIGLRDDGVGWYHAGNLRIHDLGIWVPVALHSSGK